MAQITTGSESHIVHFHSKDPSDIPSVTWALREERKATRSRCLQVGGRRLLSPFWDSSDSKGTDTISCTLPLREEKTRKTESKKTNAICTTLYKQRNRGTTDQDGCGMEENLSCLEPVGPVTEVHNFGVCRSPPSLFRPSRLCEINPSFSLSTILHTLVANHLQHLRPVESLCSGLNTFHESTISRSEERLLSYIYSNIAMSRGV
ncbi:hypothetical protein ARMGADRAFT_681582 [Armillaria gallica]|uniref:Uncharacterized protein n=1 Tax=Armillaria gallica TaxID=47427 RepID=A0A2H3CMU8_ARMGA|nr:hypothetical protein ARMGADRAFT_681582 [Armillaria gallica]